MSCCGEQYVNFSNTICCTGLSGVSRPHFKENGTVSVKCCGSEIIPPMEECCNGVGYNPLKYVCADKPSPGITLQVNK